MGRPKSARRSSRPQPGPRELRAPGTGRELARQVLMRVELEGAYATPTLAAAIDRAPHLRPAERALATEIVYGVLRRRARLDRALEALADRGLAAVDPEIRILLRVGAYQLLFLQRVPAYAAVNEAVEAAKRLHGGRYARLVNALLRRLGDRGEPALPDPARDPLGCLVEVSGFPEWLARLALRELGDERALAFAAAIAVPAPLALRANRLLTERDPLIAALRTERPDAELCASAVAPDAVIARSLDAPGATAAFREGRFAIQDVGAQVVVELCGAAAGQRILDACAGRGAKTAALAALAGNRAAIDALDISGPKLERAMDEWRRLGVSGVRPVVADLTAELPADLGPYDRILLDAPCSGLGVLRRHPELLLRRTEADLALLADRQRRMLDVVAGRLAPGGVLVYAVCTFDRREADDVVRAFLARHPDFVVEPPDPAAGSTGSTVDWPRLTEPPGSKSDGSGPTASADPSQLAPSIRTWPDRDDADAFFAVRLRRRPSHNR